MWNASTNTPTLASGVGGKGDYYIVSAAGNTLLDSAYGWAVGDHVEFNGSTWSRTPGGGSRIKLSGTLTLWVNGSAGNDSNNGLTSSTAFATLQAAVNSAYNNFDTQGFTIQIYIWAPSITYGTGVIATGPLLGNGLLTLVGIGGIAIISTTNTAAVTAKNGANVSVQYLDLRTTGSGSCILSTSGASVGIGSNMIFGACAGIHIEALNNGFIVCGSAYTVDGGAVAHWHAATSSLLVMNNAHTNFSGTIEFTNYFLGICSSLIQAFNYTFTGLVTGRRYYIHFNGSLRLTSGLDPNVVVPGDSAGTLLRSGVVNDNTATTAQAPDSTALCGAPRGANAVDWQTSRTGSWQVASGQYAVIGGGQANQASGTFSAVSGGTNNAATSNTGWIPGGNGAADRGIAGRGQWSSGIFAAAGDNQASEAVIRAVTVDATATRLTANGGGSATSENTINMPPSSSFLVKLLVKAYQIGGSSGTIGDNAAWEVTANFTFVGGTLTMDGCISVSASGISTGGAALLPLFSKGSGSNWRLAVAADTTVNGISLSGTGETNKNIRWVARSMGVELTA